VQPVEEENEAEAAAVALSLDEIPYDRNLRYVNVANDERVRHGVDQSSRLFNQVRMACLRASTQCSTFAQDSRQRGVMQEAPCTRHRFAHVTSS
jgi:hypothetical protein